jgi:Holliday junction resolvase RusA-like endonuclease
MAYHAKPYKEWLARAVDSIGVQSLAPQLTGPVSVEITVWVQRPKKTARSYPPYDLDNYAKGPLDALTKAGVWADDEQVVRLHVTKVYSDTEGIDIVIAPLALTII